jgi:hypothetical protein
MMSGLNGVRRLIRELTCWHEEHLVPGKRGFLHCGLCDTMGFDGSTYDRGEPDGQEKGCRTCAGGTGG